MNILSYINSFLHDFVQILAEMSPYLLLGFFFAGLLYAFIPRHKIERYFNGSPLKSSVLAALFGVPLPLCSCGVIPTGTAFYKNGASKGGTVSFLISTPQTGIDSILATFSLMGLPFALIRPIAALVTGITGGLITASVTKNEEKAVGTSSDNLEKKTFMQKVKSVFTYGFVDFIQDISKWLVVGLLLAAVISALIPDDFFNLLSLPPFVQMIIVLMVSVPLYICATGSIPLAAVLILKGLSPGAAFVLLMAGPATNAATITMIGKVLGKKSLLVYLSTIIIGAMTFGLIIDYILPQQWFTSIAQQHLGMHHMMGMEWWQIVSGIVLAGLIINGFIKKHLVSKKQVVNNQINVNQMSTQVIKVDGMTCNHCKANVENGVAKLPFVDSAIVNLADKTVTVEGDHLDVAQIKAAIDQLGYTVME